MYKHVLATLDGSYFSETILEHVERLVAGTEARLTLLTVSDMPDEYVAGALEGYGPLTWPFVLAPAAVEALIAAHESAVDGRALKRTKDEHQAYLEKKAAPFRDKGVTVECVVCFGNAVKGILEYAQKHDVDLIAMATHGRAGLAGLAFGSVASSVVHKATRPVLLVRPDHLDTIEDKKRVRLQV